MTRTCSGCGLRHCDGRCYMECPADYPEPTAGVCETCESPVRDDGWCPECESDGLTEVHSDPLRDAA